MRWEQGLPKLACSDLAPRSVEIGMRRWRRTKPHASSKLTVSVPVVKVRGVRVRVFIHLVGMDM